MKKKINENKIVRGTFGRMQEVEDFLPSPEEYKKARIIVHVALPLKRESMDVLQKKADEEKTTYDQVIHRLVENYIREQTSNPQL